MKNLILAVLFAPAVALAHGTIPHQASAAIESAGAMFGASHSREEQRLVTTVTAQHVGHEQFAVTFSLSSNASYAYACQENEEVEPVKWECVAR